VRRFLWGNRGVAGGDRARRTVVARGEREAVRFLRSNGYRIVGRNIVRSVGEIDLVCRDPDGVLVIVEVKARMIAEGVAAPLPEASITAAKRRKLLSLARDAARRENEDPRRVRIDVIAVEMPAKGPVRIRHHVRAVTSRR